MLLILGSDLAPPSAALLSQFSQNANDKSRVQSCAKMLTMHHLNCILVSYPLIYPSIGVHVKRQVHLFSRQLQWRRKSDTSMCLLLVAELWVVLSCANC